MVLTFLSPSPIGFANEVMYWKCPIFRQLSPVLLVGCPTCRFVLALTAAALPRKSSLRLSACTWPLRRNQAAKSTLAGVMAEALDVKAVREQARASAAAEAAAATVRKAAAAEVKAAPEAALTVESAAQKNTRHAFLATQRRAAAKEDLQRKQLDGESVPPAQTDTPRIADHGRGARMCWTPAPELTMLVPVSVHVVPGRLQSIGRVPVNRLGTR